MAHSKVSFSLLHSQYSCHLYWGILLLMEQTSEVVIKFLEVKSRALVIRYSSTRSHPPEGENRPKNWSKNCKCKKSLRQPRTPSCFRLLLEQESVFLFLEISACNFKTFLIFSFPQVRTTCGRTHTAWPLGEISWLVYCY